MHKVAHKIWLVCVIIVLLGTIAMLVAYQGLRRVQREMRHLAEIHEPIKSAAHEMEINLKGTAVGTLAYLSSPNSAFRDLVADNHADFERFHAQYLRLATTEQEKEFGATIGRVYAQFKEQGHQLKTRRDRQAITFADFLAKLEEIDTLFDQQLPTALDSRVPNDTAKLKDISIVDEGIDRIRMRTATYRWSRHQGNRALIEQNIKDCRAAFQQLKGFQWATEAQGQSVRAVEQFFEEAMNKAHEVLADEDNIQDGVARFISLRHEMDNLLDEQIQPLAAESVRQPRAKADLAVAAVVGQIAWLIPLFVLCAASASVVLIRALTRPLEELALGTEVVSGGDLSHRVVLASRDEFCILSQAFNRMVGRLQETLVSKEALEKSEASFRKLAEELDIKVQERTAQLQESFNSVEELLYTLTHDLRAPNRTMQGFAQLLELEYADQLDDRARGYLNRISAAAVRNDELIRDLLAYGRLSHDALPLDRVNARQTVETVLQAMEAEIEQRHAHIHLGQEWPLVMANETMLKQILTNLVANALTYVPPEREPDVVISAQWGSGKAVLRVTDNGIGITPEQRDRIFKPFIRLPNVINAPGTGMGLAIVKKAAERMHGTVGVDSTPGQGACFWLELLAA